jgi:predicted RNA-binding Zn ribbon-like protein
MPVPVQPLSMSLLVRIVNAWGTLARRGREEQDTPLPAPDEVADELPLAAGRLTVKDLIALADQVYPVFAAPTPAERARAVNRLLSVTGVRPALLGDPELHSGWLIANQRDAGLAAAAIGLRSQLSHGSADRLGVCADPACADAYVDASPAGQRRFCSVTCQNRSRVAAFRRRAAQKDT